VSASEFERAGADGATGAAVARYRRTLREVAEHRVVDEAEEVLARAWIAQLDEMRRAALGLVAAARLARRAARAEVRDAERGGRLGEMAVAHARLKSIEAMQDGELNDARALIAAVDAELELVCRAGIDRARRDRADHSRLRTAWRAAYGGERSAAGAADQSDRTDQSDQIAHTEQTPHTTDADGAERTQVD